jgi:hypothetical protein
MLMPNYLQMPKQQQVVALLALGWSYRRTQAETGVRRETVGRYDRARQANGAKVFPGFCPSDPTVAGAQPAADAPKAANVFPGSGAKAANVFAGSAAKRSRAAAAVYRAAITEKLDAGLSVQRIWQDLVEEFGYAASHESVKRFIRTLAVRRRVGGVFHCAPGAEAQVDFFRGAPTLHTATGEWRRWRSPAWSHRLRLSQSDTSANCRCEAAAETIPSVGPPRAAARRAPALRQRSPRVRRRIGRHTDPALHRIGLLPPRSARPASASRAATIPITSRSNGQGGQAIPETELPVLRH